LEEPRKKPGGKERDVSAGPQEDLAALRVWNLSSVGHPEAFSPGKGI
jgi:hypothetical protein